MQIQNIHVDKFKKKMDRIGSERDSLKEQELSAREELLQAMNDIAGSQGLWTLVLDEWRDDRVHAFQAAQVVPNILINGFSLDPTGFPVPILRKARFTKTGKLKFKGGAPDSKKVHFNSGCSWRLVDRHGEAQFGRSAEQVIIPDTWSDEDLDRLRAKLGELQKI